MEIFNIHLFEFLLIAGLALVIFGPERLPEVGRFIGKQLARFLAWQQQSPELQIINDVRAELDREIASLRDELMRTRTQLDVSQDMETLRKDLRSMVRLRDEPVASALAAASGAEVSKADAPPAPLEEVNSIAAPASPEEVNSIAAPAPPEASPLANGIALPEPPPILDPPPPPAPSGTVPMSRPKPLAARAATAVPNPVDERRPTLHEALEPAEPPVSAAPDLARDQAEPPALGAAERDELLHQIQTLSADLHALIAELHGRGMIGADWRGAELSSEQESLSR